MDNLTNEEIDTILTSLKYTKRNMENYQNYPSYEFKLGKIKIIEELLTKLRQMKKVDK